jgi:ribosomal protein S12 methylthiotransferase
MDDNDDDPFWLRLLYLYPDEITPDLIDLMEADRRIVRYVDLPIQHSHDDILKAMRRKTDSKHIKDTIANLRERLPDIYIRTSLMVGFPGETENHFLDLLQFVKESKLDHVGVFVYSNEDMAHSSRLDDQVPEDIKQDRYRRLMEVQWKIVEKRHKERVNRSERLRIVVEGLKEIDEDIDDANDSDSTSSSPSTTVIVGRHAGQCPEIDGQIILEGFPPVNAGERYWVEVTGTKNTKISASHL